MAKVKYRKKQEHKKKKKERETPIEDYFKKENKEFKYYAK